jgi:hypothetical protein
MRFSPAEIALATSRMTPAERAELDALLLTPGKLNLSSYLFGPQFAFVNDTANFADAVCSRRAGKSVGIGAWLLDGALENPRAPVAYLTFTRGAAKRIIWPTLLYLNRRNQLGFEPNEAELTFKRDGQAVLYLAGLDNKGEIEKVRGVGWGRVAIDESQSLPQYVKELVEDVLMPSLMDHDGKLRMIGTPAPVPAGYFHDVTHSPEWSHHRWTVWDNPHIPKAREMLDKVLRVRGLTEDDPSIQREWFGRWVLDTNSLVFRYVAASNGYDSHPRLTDYVIGVDLGYDDSDAIVVLGWAANSPKLWLVEEEVKPKQTVSQLGEILRKLRAKYEPRAVVMDTGGLGKKIAEEFNSREGVWVEAADKARKLEHIELLNDALRSGRLMARADSRFAHDAMLVEWDRSKPEAPKISDRFHSDVCDAVLYAYRRAQHWQHEEAPPSAPVPGTPEWAAEEARRMAEAAEQAIRSQHDPDAWVANDDDAWERAQRSW